MSGADAPAPRVAVRTPELPMAFEGDDFSYGMLWAFGSYQPMAAVTSVLMIVLAPLVDDGVSSWGLVLAPLYLVVGGVYGLVGSIFAMAVGTPVGWLLGRLLSRVRNETTHVIAFALLGLALGLVTMSVFLFVMSDGGRLTTDGPAVWYWYAVPAAIAVPLGQFKAARRALAADAVARRSSALDAD